MTIDNSINGNLSQPTLATPLRKEVAKTTTNQNQNNQSKNAYTDIVTISNEARVALQTKVEEYGGNAPNALSLNEHGETQQTLIDMEGVAEDDPQATPMEEEQETSSGRRGGDRGEQSEDVQTAASGTGSETTDEIEDLELDIEALEEEILDLQMAAVKDEEAKEQLKAKRVELTMLQEELTLAENTLELEG